MTSATTKKVGVSLQHEKELEFLLEEWKEARSSISRFDSISVDLRKYGFSLTTFLITAYSVVFQVTNLDSPLPVVITPFAIMILVCGLFLADRYNEVLLLASVLRCRQLEDTSHEIFENYVRSNLYLRVNLTTFIEDRVQKAKARPFSLIIYLLFVIACLTLSGVFLFAYHQQTNISPSPVYLWILIVQGIISVVFLAIVHNNMSDLIKSILDEVVIENRIVIKKLFSKEVVDKTIRELAFNVHRHYADTNFTVLTIGIGGLKFSQRIIAELKKLGRTNVASVALFAERVPIGKETFKIEIKRPEKHLIQNREIIIVDDLVSTGGTLKKVFDLCKEYKAKETNACILLNATAKRKIAKLPIYFEGLHTSEKGDFVGCGMDKEGECRDLTFIGIAKSYAPMDPHKTKKKSLARFGYFHNGKPTHKRFLANN